MKKVEKWVAAISIGVLLIGGVCAIVYGNNIKIQGGLGGFCSGVAVLVVAWIASKKNQEELDNFDDGVTTIIKDVAQYQEDSEYYGFDINMANKARYKIQKINKKRFWGCVILGVVLLAIALICLI